MLREWAGPGGGPQKLAVTLAHRYTAAGLAWDALKGTDGARARVLAAAARQADCHVALALLTFWESGSAEYDEPYRRGWRGRARHGGEQYSMGEVFDWRLSARRWQSPEGERRFPWARSPSRGRDRAARLPDRRGAAGGFRGLHRQCRDDARAMVSPRRGGALAHRAARGRSLRGREPERGARARAHGEELGGRSG